VIGDLFLLLLRQPAGPGRRFSPVDPGPSSPQVRPLARERLVSALCAPRAESRPIAVLRYSTDGTSDELPSEVRQALLLAEVRSLSGRLWA
jgi:hypothetical protein